MARGWRRRYVGTGGGPRRGQVRDSRLGGKQTLLLSCALRLPIMQGMPARTSSAPASLFSRFLSLASVARRPCLAGGHLEPAPGGHRVKESSGIQARVTLLYQVLGSRTVECRALQCGTVQAPVECLTWRSTFLGAPFWAPCRWRCCPASATPCSAIRTPTPAHGVVGEHLPLAPLTRPGLSWNLDHSKRGKSTMV